MIVKIKAVHALAEGAFPQYMSHGASGMDICACLEEPVVIEPMQRTLIPTGIAIAVPEGCEAQIRPRSGMALKHGITMLNTPGTIDSDYRGEVKLIVINLSDKPFEVVHGMRLAQMVIAQYVRAEVVQVDELDETVRGAGGFGHTGVTHARNT